jgi:LacI family transcriptional regulator
VVDGASPRTTILDVAREAGVSPATVSRVLGGSESVGPELRERVMHTAGRLGYRTNRVARALRTRSTGTVGMVVPNVANPFFPAMIRAMEGELRRRGLQLVLCDSDDDVDLEAELLLSLLDHGMDGILISPCDSIASRSAVRTAAGRIPLVQIDRIAAEELPYVGVDQDAAIARVVEHLAERGATRLAYVGPSPRISTAAERQRGYEAAARPLDPESATRVHVGDFSLDWGRDAAGRILAEGERPDAIVCANDLTAVGLLNALREHGVRVPEDVLVTGFDDTLLASVSHPQLTSVRQPSAELSRAALDALLAGPDTPARRTLPAELVVRRSTTPEG